MPLEFIRDESRRLIRLVGTEPVNIEDAIAAIDRQIAEGVGTTASWSMFGARCSIPVRPGVCSPACPRSSRRKGPMDRSRW